jgi:MtN3 and saliva related transmembrane protein
MNSFQLTGYLAGSVITVSLAPQVWKAWKTKSTADISLLWNTIYILGLVIFQAYAFGIRETPLIITNVVELILAFGLIVAKLIYK